MKADTNSFRTPLNEASVRVSKTQSRVDRETEQLSQQMMEQVNQAFEKLEAGDSVFMEHEAAKSLMEARKARIRDRDKR